jgi:hypothetical protein
LVVATALQLLLPTVHTQYLVRSLQLAADVEAPTTAAPVHLADPVAVVDLLVELQETEPMPKAMPAEQAVTSGVADQQQEAAVVPVVQELLETPPTEMVDPDYRTPSLELRVGTQRVVAVDGGTLHRQLKTVDLESADAVQVVVAQTHRCPVWPTPEAAAVVRQLVVKHTDLQAARA